MSGRTASSAARKQPCGPAPAGGLKAPLRLHLLAAGFIALFTGVFAGLVNFAPLHLAPGAALAVHHGPLMVCGFLGTVIGLERAVALGARWPYLGPLAAGAGGLALIAGFPVIVGQALIAAASVVLLAASYGVHRRQPALFTAVMALGAASWLAGNLLWMNGLAVPEVTPFWAAFLLLTIAGERLELSRLLPPSPTGIRLFVLVMVALLVSLALVQLAETSGILLFAASLIALAGWLARYDVARKTVRGTGLSRFIAVALLAGYSWLALGGFVILAAGGLTASLEVYDAALHAVFLGFVFSMIFAHAPVILPAVARFAVPFRPVFYGHVGLLHGSLALRVAGDLAGVEPLRFLGAIGNAAAILLFVLTTIFTVITARRAAAAAAAARPPV
jgi:hypothetical protein